MLLPINIAFISSMTVPFIGSMTIMAEIFESLGFIMNYSALLLPSLLLFSTAAVAMDSVVQSDKSGHTVHVGISTMRGDLSNVAENGLFSFGYDYTTKDGVIFGGYYMPELLSKSASIFGMGATIESTVLGLYSGYQFDNNFRFTGGLNFTYSQAIFSSRYATVFTDETNMSFLVGADYLFKQFLVGARISSHDVSGIDGTTFGINIGYKF